MRHIYETRLRIDEKTGPVTSFDVVAEAAVHYRSYKIVGADSAKQLAADALGPYFDNRRDQEEMLAILLDTKYRPLRIVRITRGTLDASLVHPREVFKPACWISASAVILVHNHPSGDCTPSSQDLSVTRQIEEAGKLIGINVLDHLIIAGEEVLSIKQYEQTGRTTDTALLRSSFAE